MWAIHELIFRKFGSERYQAILSLQHKQSNKNIPICHKSDIKKRKKTTQKIMDFMTLMRLQKRFILSYNRKNDLGTGHFLKNKGLAGVNGLQLCLRPSSLPVSH